MKTPSSNPLRQQGCNLVFNANFSNLSWISQSGQYFINSSGQHVMFHGINVIDKMSPYAPCATGFSLSDVEFIRNQGLNAVRLGLLFTGLMPSPGVINERYLDEIASTVELLQENGIYTLLDFHQDGWGPSLGPESANDGFPAWLT